MELLDLDDKSKVLMITSAGCNALNYVLKNPLSIDCVDLNYRQNALLDLKLAFFKASDFFHLFQFFGKGKYIEPRAYYDKYLRAHLSLKSQLFWDEKIASFLVSRVLEKASIFMGQQEPLLGFLICISF